MKKLLIIGAGGHGRVVADSAESTKKYQEIAFLDDCFSQRKKNHHWSIIGAVDTWSQYVDQVDFIIAFGNNVLRLNITRELLSAGILPVNIIHPSAIISPHVTFGHGNVVFANAVINIGAKLADACIINTAATVDHDCHIHSGVHISPGAHLAGGVTVGELSWLGIGSSINECLTLAKQTQVGAGAAVINDTTADSLYLGIPAKRYRNEK